MAFALGEGTAPVIRRPSELIRSRPLRAPVILPEGAQKALLQRTCGGTCHALTTVTGVRRDRAAWTAMVENMVARGAKASDQELKSIVDFLATHAGK